MNMYCPACGSAHAQSAERCYCGYRFESEQHRVSQHVEAGARFPPFDQAGPLGLFGAVLATFLAALPWFIGLTLIGTVLEFAVPASLAALGLESALDVTLLLSPLWWFVLCMASALVADAVAVRVKPQLGDTLLLAITAVPRFVGAIATWLLLVLFGLALLVVPGLNWAIRYAFGPISALLDGAAALQALRASFDATKDRVLQSVLAIIVPALVLGAVGVAGVAAVVAVMPGQALDLLLDQRMKLAALSGQRSGGLGMIVVVASVMAAAQLMACHAVVLYRSLQYAMVPEKRRPLPEDVEEA